MNKTLKQWAVRLGIIVALVFIMRSVKNFILILANLEGVVNLPAHAHLFQRMHLVKVLAVIIIVFILYNRKSLAEMSFQKNNFWYSFLFLIMSFIFFFMHYALNATVRIFSITSFGWILLITLGGLVLLGLYFLSLSVAIIGYKNAKTLWHTYKKQSYFFAPLFIIGTILFIFFQKLWFFFSFAISKILYHSFNLIYPVSYQMATKGPILRLPNFAVSIGEPCSGIDSMLLFTAFYAAIFALDYSRIKKKPAIILFIVGFIGVYLVNILRLFLLLIIGIHISPEFAVGMFHTQAGWVLFVIYFLLYYWLIKKYIYKKT